MFDILSPIPENSHGKLLLNVLDSLVGNSTTKSKRAPDIGDVIYVQRLGYKHFGVYVGKKRVIHYAHDSGGTLCIHEAPISEFLDGATDFYACDFPKDYGRPSPISIQSMMSSPQFSVLGAWLQNHRRSKYHLYSPQETVKRARQRLGETEYNLILNNCEHFALWCKTGLHESHQVEDFFELTPKIPFTV